jgi:hypothetical protein
VPSLYSGCTTKDLYTTGYVIMRCAAAGLGLPPLKLSPLPKQWAVMLTFGRNLTEIDITATTFTMNPAGVSKTGQC